MFTRRYRSREACREALRIAALAVSLQLLGACSFALPSLLPPDETATGSVGPVPERRLRPGMADEDWRRAKGSLAIALDVHGNGRPVRWDNPDTRTSGTFVPAGAPRVEADEVCRDFQASITPAGSDPFHVSGKACKVSGEWLIRRVDPRRT